MVVVERILSVDQTNEESYFLKLEALWILTNFSGVVLDEELKLVFLSTFAERANLNSEVIQADFDQNKSSILDKVDRMLREIIRDGCQDLKTLNMILNFLGNCIREMNPGFAKKVVKETCILEGLSFFVENSTNLQSELLSHIQWVVQNIVAKVVKK